MFIQSLWTTSFYWKMPFLGLMTQTSLGMASIEIVMLHAFLDAREACAIVICV